MITLTAIFFDATGTLFTTRGSVGEIYLMLARKHGVTVPAGVLSQAFVRAFAAAPPLAFPEVDGNRLRQLERDWWHRVVSQVWEQIGQLPGPSFEEYFAEVFEVFKGRTGWQLYPETLPVLSELRQRGYTLGIISNFDSRLFAVCHALGLTPLLDSLTISSQAGVAKPHHSIFAAALKRHRLFPHQAAHVGDSERADVQGAASAGLTPIFLDRSAEHPPLPGVATIHTLQELPALLRSPATASGRQGRDENPEKGHRG